MIRKVIIIDATRNYKISVFALVKRILPEVQVVFQGSSFESAKVYLSQTVGEQVDLIFIETQILMEGSTRADDESFPLHIPAVLVGRRAYLLSKVFPFRVVGCIAYPVNDRKISVCTSAIRTYFSSHKQIRNTQDSVLSKTKQPPTVAYKLFHVFKKKGEYQPIRINTIMAIYYEQKLYKTITNSGVEYESLNNLRELEVLLPSSLFIRINKRTIINMEYIASFRTIDKVKIEVRLESPLNPKPLYLSVSQDYAAEFRKRIGFLAG
jgi:DNA-binding LytR/AlgR family response regulator